tara:strand:+ start:4175 stop:4714 length:540 start_codon:yes stop_codon:yes gene_type:complete
MIETTFDQQVLSNNYWISIVDSHHVGINRERRNVLYRFAFFVSCRETTNLSLSNIGRIIKKDHATVLHAMRSHETNYRFDAQYREIYTEMHSSLSDIIGKNTEKVYDSIKKRALQINPDFYENHIIKTYKQRLDKQEVEYKETIETLKDTLLKTQKHNKILQKRMNWLNDECLRLKNLL